MIMALVVAEAVAEELVAVVAVAALVVEVPSLYFW
jgi:hypothetical protein